MLNEKKGSPNEQAALYVVTLFYYLVCKLADHCRTSRMASAMTVLPTVVQQDN